MKHASDFRFSFLKALTSQLLFELDQLTPAPLTRDNIAALKNSYGVYQLWEDTEVVYVGKAEPSLPTRLTKHLRKLSGRQNLDLRFIGFSCLYVDPELSVVAPEKQLISHFDARWNGTGFGPNDPGEKRDTTEFGPNHFDTRHPIRLDDSYTRPDGGSSTDAHELAKWLKEELPFTFRYAKPPKFQNAFQDYEAAKIVPPSDTLTAREWLALIARALPTYEMTALPGYVILYPKGRGPYPSGTTII